MKSQRSNIHIEKDKLIKDGKKMRIDEITKQNLKKLIIIYKDEQTEQKGTLLYKMFKIQRQIIVPILN